MTGLKIRVRMAAYEKSTRPLMEFYQKRGLLVSIEAATTPDETFQRTLKILNDVVAHSTNSR